MDIIKDYAYYQNVLFQQSEMSFPFLAMNAEDVSQTAGQLNFISLPAVVLYSYGKDDHRQARIIDFYELEKRMMELVEQYDG